MGINLFQVAAQKHGLPPALNVHSLRHTNASLLLTGGTDVATVAGACWATASTATWRPSATICT